MNLDKAEIFVKCSLKLFVLLDNRLDSLGH